MKKQLFIMLAVFPLLMTACKGSSSNTPEIKPDYTVKTVNIYRTNKKVDKTIDLRFYNKTPNIPYISVSEFYREFFKTNLQLNKNNNVYTYNKGNNAYLKFDVQENVIGIYNIDAFSNHPDFIESNYQTYLVEGTFTSTTMFEKTIGLNNYHIDLYGDNEAYVPLTLLSSSSGGLAGYNISYNEKDIFVLDSRGQLEAEDRDFSYFGNLYTAPLSDYSVPRAQDLAEYNYYQLCYNIDNYRGYTSHLIFGDNNLISLGLNGLLEKYYPALKQMLLSTDRTEYYTGFSYLFKGLFDGGHTISDFAANEIITNAANSMTNSLDDDVKDLGQESTLLTLQMLLYRTGYATAKKGAFTDLYNGDDKVNYYTYDETTKTAYIGFDSFETNYEAWNKYYTEGKKAEDIPTTGDSYTFIRSSLYQALEDNAENVILDLSTNGGGASSALCGIFALFNDGEVSFESNNTVDKVRYSEHYRCDINLDGVFNELDTIEANKFKQFKVAVLTSEYSFSCGNLLPSMMKEAGFKIVGQKSGGGSCAITYESTADGLTYYRSSHHCLSNLSGENIDSGVAVDYEVEVVKTDMLPGYGVYNVTSTKFYDFVTIAEYLNTLEE